MELQKVLDYIDNHREQYIGLLQTLCRQPSVSATGEGIPEMIELVKSSLCTIGAQPQQIETAGNPVIYAEMKGESPRIFGFYDHYDVQPVDPIEEWDSDPFAAEIRDGVLYARGCADNKDGLAARICAVDAWQKVHGKLPCGVKFLVEGEEEVGSPNLDPFAEAHPELLACDGYCWEGGYREAGGPAEIDFGVKGLLYVELRAKRGSMDAHSMNAAIAMNPAWRLVWALNTLKDQNERILIDGFYDGIPPISEAERAAFKTDTFNEQENLRMLGLSEFLGGRTGDKLLEKLYYEPTCNICGFSSGYEGEGSKTVLPSSAAVKIDIRLVPGQEPDRIYDLLVKHLDKHGFGDIEVIKHSGCPAFRTDASAPFCRAVVDGLTELYGETPSVRYSSAGTSPMYSFCKAAGIPAAMFGASIAGSQIHAPNEHLPVDNFIETIKITVAVMKKLAEV